MVWVLKEYEQVSGQMINKNKSFFYLHEKTPIGVRALTDINHGSFPFAFLGCPVFYGRKNKNHFEELLRKVAKRMLCWQNKFLSFGGKFILISNMLQSIPEGWVSDHYMMLQQLYSPNYGGILEHQLLPYGALICGINIVREEVEHEIWWQIKSGKSNFWFDNWTQQGALYYTEEKNNEEEEIEVKHFITNGTWNIVKLQRKTSTEMIEHIVENISPMLLEVENNSPWWLGIIREPIQLNRLFI
ncbi:hypothetical protein H5410_002848 [Solanum commersonii]|uniref:Uncharacterized protein n=1 Tax=Solanum commersonii TaxID=4109 RepID=A0A9J6B3D7_SOLCO|nr:hypothetical protein H5410_002848 [Solanum commersonii]